MSRRLTIGPFNRVEGDLEVTLDVADGRVASAQVSSSLYRGFEHILLAKHPLDALVIVPRICGICSVSQSSAAASAPASAAQRIKALPPSDTPTASTGPHASARQRRRIQSISA